MIQYPFAFASALFFLSFGCSSSHKMAEHHTTPVTAPAADAQVARTPAGYTVQSFPILEALQSQGQTLSNETLSWMKKWRGIDLEDSSQYRFKELSGSTSVNLKIQKIDPSDEKGFKSRGSFVTRNSAANPNTELACFNLAAILGYDHVARPAVRYELGPTATQSFKDLILKAKITGEHRSLNKKNILAMIESRKSLKGVLKAGSPDSVIALDAIANPRVGVNGGPRTSHPIIQSVQAGSAQPVGGTQIQLHRGYSGDALELAKEYSILMTLDAIFQQWDRYSGGNVEIQKDADGKTHFYFGDNGGADLTNKSSRVQTNLSYFSRYDRNAVTKLKEIHDFFENPSKGFLNYTDAEAFVTDLGLMYDYSPAVYAERLKRNIKLFLEQVQKNEEKFGNSVYFENR